MSLLSKILGDPNVREVKRVQPLVDRINALSDKMHKLSDAELSALTTKFKERLEAGESLDDLLPEAYAAVREASDRVLGMRHFDVQLVGGIILHEGKIAEMRTGEGKTLVATLPLYLNALTGKGVHLVTANDYLAKIGTGWNAPLYHKLGLVTGVIVHEQGLIYDPEYTDEEHEDERLRHLKPVSRAEAYAADITYGTNNEFGFDYLRDNMVDDVSKMVQRDLNYAIVDEVDSILVDEARTPLIISAPAEDSTDKYYQFARIAAQLKPEEHYTVDEKMKAVTMTDDGISAVERALGVDNVYEAGRIEDVHHIEQALKAEALFKNDRDYVSREGEIIIVDEFTGRLMHGRRYSEGLHQAIEAKEGVEIRQESLTLATITFQNYFRLYNKLAGMTGTAATEAEEFSKIYNLEVTTIPTHRPMVRKDLSDQIYKTEAGKFRAVAADVKEKHDRGQPVLLGTVSIEKNELLSQVLEEAGVPHQVLNAKNNEREAGIVAGAGHKGAVTLATNIAGRGTDIVLGDGVADLGGLHVIGTERHESRRIDNQLRGRSGRQGDPGSSQFYVSLEDDLMRIFGGERIAGLMDSLGLDEDTPIQNSIVNRSIESAQKKVEGHNFDIRKQLVEYDDVMNKHREVVYARRRKALENQNLRPEITEMIVAELAAIVTAHTDAKTGVIDHEAIYEAAVGILPLDSDSKKKLANTHPKDILPLLNEQAEAVYDARVKEFGEDNMRIIERLTYLRTLDNLWIEHLEAMEGLREGIGLRAIGQRDPLVEYKHEGYRLFKSLISVMEAEIASTVFKVSIVHEHQAPVETALTKAAREASTNAPLDEPANKRGPAPKKTEKAVVNGKKVGRNDLCPCGSGLKYKKCGMINSPKHRG
ncbi:MAG TPA: preprotein translocase subunit SecA [Candidatus Saccharimonadia bacterium]|nr:preprotein translocase subunit SecA [Candidatus Saccharimonadia bacterium]